MYLHLGNNVIERKKSVIGIFDLDITSQSHLTRAFLAAAEQAGEVENAADDIPRSFVVCRDGEQRTVFLSQMSCQTLLKRAAEGLK